MPRPSSAITTGLRPELLGSFEEYPLLSQENGFVGLNVFPPLEVPNQAGTYGIIPVEQVKRNVSTSDLTRAPTGDYNEIDWKFETFSYVTTEYGIRVPVDDREAAMYQDFIEAEMLSASIARLALLEDLEQRTVALALDASIPTSAVATIWTTVATATPITDIGTAMKAVYNNTGFRANTLALHWKDLWNMKLTSQFQDFVKYTQRSLPEDMGPTEIASALGLSKVFVAGVSVNTAADDAAASFSDVWTAGKVFVGRTADANSSHKEVCIGRTHHWAADGSRVTGVAESYYDDAKRRQIVRVRHDVQTKLIYPKAGYVLTGAS